MAWAPTDSGVRTGICNWGVLSLIIAFTHDCAYNTGPEVAIVSILSALRNLMPHSHTHSHIRVTANARDGEVRPH